MLLLSLCALVGLGAGASGQETLEFDSSYDFSVEQGAPKTVAYQLVESRQVRHCGPDTTSLIVYKTSKGYPNTDFRIVQVDPPTVLAGTRFVSLYNQSIMCLKIALATS